MNDRYEQKQSQPIWETNNVFAWRNKNQQKIQAGQLRWPAFKLETFRIKNSNANLYAVMYCCIFLKIAWNRKIYTFREHCHVKNQQNTQTSDASVQPAGYICSFRSRQTAAMSSEARRQFLQAKCWELLLAIPHRMEGQWELLALVALCFQNNAETWKHRNLMLLHVA